MKQEKSILVRDLMNTEVFTLSRNDKLSVADELMKQRRIRHIPVLDEEGAVCGVVSQRDLFRGALLRALGYGSRLENQLLEMMPVKEAMSTAVHTIYPEASITEAAGKMLQHKIGCLPVVQNERLVGILTEADFVRLAKE